VTSLTKTWKLYQQRSFQQEDGTFTGRDPEKIIFIAFIHANINMDTNDLGDGTSQRSVPNNRLDVAKLGVRKRQVYWEAGLGIGIM
jgi:hypothetical protein